MNADTSTDEITWALIDFAAWCFQSKGNLASTISGKFAAVQYFHRTVLMGRHGSSGAGDDCQIVFCQMGFSLSLSASGCEVYNNKGNSKEKQ